MSSCVGFCAPIVVILLIVCSFFIFVYYFCILYLDSLVLSVSLIVVISILVIMFYWSFINTIFTKNDHIFDVYKLSDDEYNRFIEIRGEDRRSTMLVNLIVKRGLLVYMCSGQGKVRFCYTCKLMKPDRTHHCTTCDTCILKMDHHCPWVNNCVGFYNYKMFFLSLVYGSLYCLFYVCCTMQTVLQVFMKETVKTESIIISIGFAVALVIGLIISVFTFYHLYLIANNQTTIENVHSPTFVEDEVPVTFDLGCRRNIAAVFGEECCLWWIPVFSAIGDGHDFQMKQISS